MIRFKLNNFKEGCLTKNFFSQIEVLNRRRRKTASIFIEYPIVFNLSFSFERLIQWTVKERMHRTILCALMRIFECLKKMLVASFSNSVSLKLRIAKESVKHFLKKIAIKHIFLTKLITRSGKY